MKIDCNIIRDLLPLYIDNLTSEQSNKTVEKHIEECEECRIMFNTLKNEITSKENNTKEDMWDKQSKKAIKRIKKRIMSLVVGTLVIGIILGLFGYDLLGFVEVKRSRSVANNFLSELEQGDFDEAFEYVLYFDVASDIQPTISYENAKQIWVERVKQLKENNTYLKEYKDLTVWIDDGAPRGKVIIVVVEKGKEREYTVYLQFAGEKIQQLYEFPQDMTELEKAISGHVPEG